MRIYLNTRGFDNDYQWFAVGEDNSLSVTKNYWEIPELTKLPITDEFSLVLGKMGNGELYLLATDLDSRRIDSKDRVIKNSILLISEDEIILRKIATLLLFDHDEFVDGLSYVIEEFSEGEHGITVEYAQLIKTIDSFTDRYDVKFEFDADTNERIFTRFAELYLKYTTQTDDGDEQVSYRVNPIFEFKLKRFMLSEIFPEDLEVIFAYLPTLTLEQIEKGQFYLTVTKELDRLAKNIFLRDLEDWAKIEIKESRFKELKESFNKYRSEIFIFSLAIAVFVPLIGSYIALSSTNSELSKENILLKTKHKELELKANQFEERSKFLERENIKLVEENGELIGENSELENELRTERSAMASIEKRVNREMNTLQLQELNDEILTLRNSLGKCESEKENISIQRQKLSVGYKWYKDLYNSCQEGRK